VTYSFSVDGRAFRQETYDIASHWQVGQTAAALYLPGEPEISRLQGEKRPHSGCSAGSFTSCP